MSLNEIIPAAWRKPTYLVYALIGVVLGAIAQAFGGVDNVPEWHAIVTNIYLYVGGAFGLTAAANTIVSHRVDSDDAEEIDPEDAEDVPLDEDSEYEDEALADAEVDLSPPDAGYEPKH